MIDPGSEKSKLINTLANFYEVDTMGDLILKQNYHIERLQERVRFLTPKNNFIITKVRE